ncbi:hypothetical protein AYO20_11758 [Fonsecaea nubica]|nr:hypothetical protein AYO20_11758 [Fonsecaea nubica]OAL18314.1 hypothetical protein AYO20_11758 [Fonsecaea nubica]
MELGKFAAFPVQSLSELRRGKSNERMVREKVPQDLFENPSDLRPAPDLSNSVKMTTAIKSIRSLVPLLDRVLVQRIKAESRTAAGIYLPESSVKELNEAKVLAVGPGGFDKDGKRMAMSVQEGDKVLIPQYGGSPVKVGEEEFHLFRDHELLAKINE